jgi:hypothetical protein
MTKQKRQELMSLKHLKDTTVQSSVKNLFLAQSVATHTIMVLLSALLVKPDIGVLTQRLQMI